MAKRGRKAYLFCPDVAEFRRLVESQTIAADLQQRYKIGIKTLRRWASEQGLTIYQKPKLPPKWGRNIGSIYTSQSKSWQMLNTPEKLAQYATDDFKEKFWGRVKYSEGCWTWSGPTSAARGYGSTSFAGRPMASHRVAWMLEKGVIPPDLHVLHSCDNRLCVRPDHLWLGTNTDNYRDRDSKGRMPHGVRCGANKLTEQQVREIRASTEATKIIGERYGIHPAHVSKIRLRHKWTHLD